MYQKPLYTVKSSEGNSFFIVELSSDHRIFQAHFPGSPVLPGACIIEIFNQLINLIQSQALTLQHIRQVKFLKMIEPDKTNRIRFSFDSILQEEDGMSVIKAYVTSPDGAVIYAKLSAEYAVR